MLDRLSGSEASITVAFSGNNIIGTCDDLFLDATSTQGQYGRDWVTLNWELTDGPMALDYEWKLIGDFQSLFQTELLFYRIPVCQQLLPL